MKPSIPTRLVFICCLGVALSGCATTSPPTQRTVHEESTTTPIESDEDIPMTTLPEDFDVQGHRGARGLKPENTLPSFEVALDHEVDTIELDLHFSADGEAIVWHDEEVKADFCRGLGDSPRAIRELTAEQLGAINCDRNPDPASFPEQDSEPTAVAGDNYSIVTLAEVFSFANDYAESPEKTQAQRANAKTVRFNIETKRKPEHPEYIGDGFDGESAGPFEREVVRVIREHEVTERATLQSFDHRSVWAARELEPEMRFAVLESERRDSLMSYAEKGAHVWSPKHVLVTATTLAEARRAGLAVIPWTVNDVDEMERLIRLGVDGIITDRPDLLATFR